MPKEVVIPELAVPTACCPNPKQWSCYDDNGTELEVLEFLAMMIVTLKPRVVIETGCYKGYGTEMLARGIIRNGFGHLWTTDTGHDMAAMTKERLDDRNLDEVVSVCHGSGLQLIADLGYMQIDFAFLDSGPDDTRCQELRELLPKLAPSGVVAIHDVGIQHGLRPFFFRTVTELGLEYFTFDTPRGLALVRKPWRSLAEEIKG